jgi:hypothetical protein
MTSLWWLLVRKDIIRRQVVYNNNQTQYFSNNLSKTTMTIIEQYLALCEDIHIIQDAYDNGEIPSPPQTPQKKQRVLNFIQRQTKIKDALVKAHPEIHFPQCPIIPNNFADMKKSEDKKQQLECSLRSLDAKMLLVSDNSEFRGLFKIIHGKGWTSLAEHTMFNELVNQMHLKATQLEHLKDILKVSSDAILGKE